MRENAGMPRGREMRLAWNVAHRRQREAALSFYAVCAIALAGLGLSAIFWRQVVWEANMNIAQQVDYEDGVLCAKFGFPQGTEKHLACKLDLLDLRRDHEKLVAANSLP
jgi:hypothetical protein